MLQPVSFVTKNGPTGHPKSCTVSSFNCPKGLLCRELKNLRSLGLVSVCSSVRNAVKFSLILLWKGFGGVTHRPLLDPKFGRFTSKFVDFLDQKWNPKMDSFRHARRATLPCGCNLVNKCFIYINFCAPQAKIFDIYALLIQTMNVLRRFQTIFEWKFTKCF